MIEEGVEFRVNCKGCLKRIVSGNVSRFKVLDEVVRVRFFCESCKKYVRVDVSCDAIVNNEERRCRYCDVVVEGGSVCCQCAEVVED